jgi:hypothetical protein
MYPRLAHSGAIGIGIIRAAAGRAECRNPAEGRE